MSGDDRHRVDPPASGPNPATGRVLAVDDEPEILDLYVEFLTEAGHTVDAAPDGAAAAALVSEKVFDVVVSDIDMPGLDGLELLKAVRQRDLDLPVVLVTGRPSLDTAARAVEHGALRYLVKPVRAQALLDVVQHALQLHQVARLKREALALAGAQGFLVGDRAGLEARFASALERLWPAFQPIVRADTGEAFAYEALLRSDEEALGSPAALLDAAERLGRLDALGRRMRVEVARALSARPGVQAFVNVHARDLLDSDLLDPAAPLSQFAPRVVLEITERAALDTVRDVASRTQALRALGFRLAVDDLGAGYAGLTSFALLEPAVVKLDMSLVRAVDAQPTKQRLVRSMVGLSREMGIALVAEGVETEAERATLCRLGCELLQGYLIGRPARGLGGDAAPAGGPPRGEH